jgi:hypothetical protein
MANTNETNKTQIMDKVRQLFNFSDKTEDTKEVETKLEDVVEVKEDVMAKFIDVTLDDKVIRIESEVIEAGLPVFLVVEEVATLVEDDSADGTYEYEGQTFIVVSGMITEVMPTVEQEQEQEKEDISETTEELIELEQDEDAETKSKETKISQKEKTAEDEKVFDFESAYLDLTERIQKLEAQASESSKVQENFSGELKNYVSNTPHDMESLTKFKTETTFTKGSSSSLEDIRNIRNQKTK